MADISKMRLALFRPLNLDNSMNDRNMQKRSSLDGLYTYVYTVKGVSCFSISVIQAVQSPVESIVLMARTFSYV